MIRRIFVLIFTVWIVGCASPHQKKDTIEVVTTIGQITDIVQHIGGKHLHVQGLMGPGVDPHLYKASESDVRKLGQAEIIFYNGLRLEAQMVDIFDQMSRSKKTVPLGEAVPEKLRLGSIKYPEHFDPHIWFDLTLWSRVAEKARDVLIAYDPEHADDYRKNAEEVLAEIAATHQYILERANELKKSQRVLVTAHDAFRYFGRAYDFEVLGLQGISTQSEPGIADVRRLADYIVESQIKAVFIETSVPVRNILALQEAVAAKGWSVDIGGKLFSDAMGTKGTPEGTYIGMVRHNIDTIVDALK